MDLPDLPEIYVSSQYTINAIAFVIEKYQITLYAGLIDFLTEEELLAVIGHELGHVKGRHMLYKTMAYILRYLGAEVLNGLLPAGTGLLASIPLQLAILHWERMAEFSCDRAALLVVQDPEVVASALTKLAGGSKKILPDINLDGVLQQAQEYDDSGEQLLEKIHKINMMLLQTHPFPIVRAKRNHGVGRSRSVSAAHGRRLPARRRLAEPDPPQNRWAKFAPIVDKLAAPAPRCARHAAAAFRAAIAFAPTVVSGCIQPGRLAPVAAGRLAMPDLGESSPSP